MKKFIFLVVFIILGVGFTCNYVSETNNIKKSVSAKYTEIVESKDTALFGRKVTLFTESGKKVEIQTTKYKKGSWIQKGDKVFVFDDEVIINGKAYQYY